MTANRLLAEYNSLPQGKPNRCVICSGNNVTPEVREFIEAKLKDPNASISPLVAFLRSKKLWTWSEGPIRTHRKKCLGAR